MFLAFIARTLGPLHTSYKEHLAYVETKTLVYPPNNQNLK